LDAEAEPALTLDQRAAVASRGLLRPGTGAQLAGVQQQECGMAMDEVAAMWTRAVGLGKLETAM